MKIKDEEKFLKNEARILVVGAGGLGCEILRCIVKSRIMKSKINPRQWSE